MRFEFYFWIENAFLALYYRVAVVVVVQRVEGVFHREKPPLVLVRTAQLVQFLFEGAILFSFTMNQIKL